MSKFTKRPIEVEAKQLTRKTKIETREGVLYGYKGDWLITGIQGEKYPCNDQIFRDTYSPSGDDKCTFCKYNGQDRRPCDVWEVCVFEWRFQQ